MKKRFVLGIDVGGSGIKGAIVNTKTGTLESKRHRIETPRPASPTQVAQVISKLVKKFKWTGPVGIGFPAAIQKGVSRTAANVSSEFIDLDINTFFSKETRCNTFVINDADAAGIAEMRFGAGKTETGVVLLATVGTGIGTVLFTKGEMLPNTELGHLILNGADAELFASDATRQKENLTWLEWGDRFNEYLNYIYKLFYPDLVIIGGGISKYIDEYKNQIQIPTKVVPAELLNYAGIIGAATYARECSKKMD